MTGAAFSLALAVAQLFSLHDRGYGPVHDGMTVKQAERAIGMKLVPADDSTPADGCWHLKPEHGHDGVNFMVQDGRITRASLWNEPSQIRTLRGLGIGSTEAEVKRLYGPGLKIESHAYDGDEAHYLTYWTRGGTHGVRFETDAAGRVNAIHAGDVSIELIEGCS